MLYFLYFYFVLLVMLYTIVCVNCVVLLFCHTGATDIGDNKGYLTFDFDLSLLLLHTLTIADRFLQERSFSRKYAIVMDQEL